MKQIVEYIAAILKRPEPYDGAARSRDILFFTRFARPVWKLGVASLALVFVATALKSILPLGAKALIDFVIMGRDAPRLSRILSYVHLESHLDALMNFLQSINMLVLAMLVIGISVGLIEIVQKYLNLKFEQEMTFNLQTALFEHLLRFPMSFFKKKQTGYLVSRVSDDVNTLEFLFSHNLSQLLRYVFYLIFGILILFTLSVKLTLISIALVPAYVFINLFFAGRQRDLSRAEQEKLAEVSRDMHEILSGVEVIKTHTSEAREVDKVSLKLRSLINTKIMSFLLFLISSHAVRGFQFLSTLVVMWIGAGEIKNGHMTIGDYVAFTTYVVYLSNSIRGLSLFHIMLQPLFASMDRMLEIFRIVPEVDSRDAGAKGVVLSHLKGEVCFEDVSFSYDGDRTILSGINFRASPGEAIAFRGVSGAGKTTIVNLILKFYSPDCGHISLDGHEYDDIDTLSLRRQIGVVSQDVFLFNETVENNIRYGRPTATRSEVEAVARKARIHDEIAGLPDGYETYIGERGVKLSAGQRQRISIARAFLSEPDILVLDEPTSFLDEGTIRLFKSSLRELISGRTTFIISHSETILDMADRIFNLGDGRLNEETPVKTGV